MAFPDDERGPYIGKITLTSDASLYLNTGYESSGFRQAMGGGQLLARMIAEGTEWIDDAAASVTPLLKGWRTLLPTRKRGFRLIHTVEP